MGIGLGACTTTPDRLDDIPLACNPETTIYRLTAVDPSVRVADEIDLDGDGTNDDALGRAHDMLASIAPAFAIATRMPARLAGDVPWLVAITRCGEDARVTIDQGVALDHGFVVAGDLPRAAGTLKDGALAARDGTARLPLVALADGAAAGWTAADGLVVEATVDGDRLYGVFGAAIDAAVARDELAPPIADFLTAQPADDLLRVGADADHDGIVTPAELTATAMYQALLAGDLVVRAPDGTPRSGAPATSIAFAFSASR